MILKQMKILVYIINKINNMHKKLENYKSRLNHIAYTFKHIIAINKCAKQYHIWTPAYLLHDVDKIFMYLFLPLKYNTKDIHHIHEINSKHHRKYKYPNKINWEMAIMDWECARFTKPDKLLNAYDTLMAYCPEVADKCLPIMKKIRLIK